MKKNLILVALCFLTGCRQHIPMVAFDADKELEYCSRQVNRALAQMRDSDRTMEPRNILDNDTAWNCRKASAEEWCSGFWPGILWMDYGYEKGKKREQTTVRKAAEEYTESLSHLDKQPAYDHDLGFLVINSFLKGYEQTQNERYKQIALACADTLATLYNDKVGTILSWPRHVKDYGGHNTIMDNMINLELLFWASENGGSQRLKDIAVRHAETTMRNHFRKDGSCYHVAVYDTLTGKFIKGVTHQGFSDRSTWARGQAWAVYGYTMVYRYTHNPVFLNFAEKVTEAYLRRLKETGHGSKRKTYTDLIPKWDFDDPDPKAPKDASAACVVADALLELSQYVVGEKRERYRGIAVEILRQLSTPAYQSGSKNDSFLLHSTGHKPAGTEIDASIIYADYYYLEALTRLKMMQ